MQNAEIQNQNSGDRQEKYLIQFPSMPLASYRELAAHLSQVFGVKASLLSQRSQQFDYYQSQIEGLWLEYSDNAEPGAEQQVERILAYYRDRYGNYEKHPCDKTSEVQ
jgi:hypothetical protein